MCVLVVHCLGLDVMLLYSSNVMYALQLGLITVAMLSLRLGKFAVKRALHCYTRSTTLRYVEITY